jgi:hypothetical protein
MSALHSNWRCVSYASQNRRPKSIDPDGSDAGAVEPGWLACVRHKPNIANTLASIDDSSWARALRTKNATCRGDLPRRRRTGALGMWLA